MTSDDDDDDYFVVVLGLIITSPIKDQFIVLASASLRLPYLYVLYLTDAVPILVVMQSSMRARQFRWSSIIMCVLVGPRRREGYLEKQGGDCNADTLRYKRGGRTWGQDRKTIMMI